MPSFEGKKIVLFLKGCIFHPNQGVQLEKFSIKLSNFAFYQQSSNQQNYYENQHFCDIENCFCPLCAIVGLSYWCPVFPYDRWSSCYVGLHSYNSAHFTIQSSSLGLLLLLLTWENTNSLSGDDMPVWARAPNQLASKYRKLFHGVCQYEYIFQ